MSKNYMYSNFVFGGLKVPHNDYVQMSCDSGIIGVVLYLLAVFAIIVHSFFVYQKYTDVSIKMCAIVAGSSIVGLLLRCIPIMWSITLWRHFLYSVSDFME